ncbi:hypothetical protein Poly21_44070 [Allorhodopirellula heiligendammensis]|uniref:Uncharacterized protein n=1 Tax=Allorhodopirellula heiligendammensis TaxID=2714739 RepID=A0A5C6BEF2_9BACT|nr:hypothetical protein Poly21_44070 [Allorhodopirellula heiligendammensis]
MGTSGRQSLDCTYESLNAHLPHLSAIKRLNILNNQNKPPSRWAHSAVIAPLKNFLGERY